MSKPNWTLELIRLLFPRNPSHGKITKLPGAARWFEKRFFEGDHLLALPRDKVVRVDQQLEEPEQTVLPSRLVDHFIDKMDFHWIMDFCICRRSMPCKDYSIDLGCIFMGEAARGINPEWGRRVTRHEAKEHISRCEEAGLIHFIGKSKLDTVWLWIVPGEKLLTICNCCPCCCVTRGLAHTHERLSSKLKKAPGVEVWVNDACLGCGACTDTFSCFSGAIQIHDGRALITTACRGCGRCLDACPHQAIEISIDSKRFMRESIEQISRVVDIPS